MDWHTNLRTFVSRPEPSFNFLYNYNNYDPFIPGVDHHVKQSSMVDTGGNQGLSIGGVNQDKKKRLSCDQLDSLEKSFQEEIKLDPDRKMQLSRQLGLQPRQIAVWFQNRRARWKAKQLERLYDSLKHEFDAVSKEKLKLQQEVSKLKSILREQTTRKQASTTGNTEVSGEETVESTSVAIRSSGEKARGTSSHQIAECNYVLNVDEYNPVSSPYWAVLPTNYPN